MARFVATLAAALALGASSAGETVHRLDGGLGLRQGLSFPIPITNASPPENVRATPSATVTQSEGPGPKKLRLAPGALTAPAEDTTLPVFFASKFFQVHTAISVAFPATLTASGGPAGAVFFSAGGRSGGATETWCPGSGATPPFACTDPGNGAINGLLRYTATRSQFGGPARIQLGGSVDWAIRGGDAAPCTYGGTILNKLCLASMAQGLPVDVGVVGGPFGAVATKPASIPASGRLYVTVTGAGRIVNVAGPTASMADGLPDPGIGYADPGPRAC